MDIIKTITGVLVAAIVLLVVAVPIMTDGIETINTVVRNSDELYLTMTNNSTITFTSTDNDFTINGEVHSWLSSSTGNTPDRYSTPVIFGQNFMVAPPVKLSDESWSKPHIITQTGNVGQADNLTISGGTLSYTADGTTASIDVTGPIYYISDKGTWGMYKRSTNIDYGKTAYLVLYNWSGGGTRMAGIYSIQDGQTSAIFNPIYWSNNVAPVTAESVTIDATVTDDDLNYKYQLNNLTVDTYAFNYARGTIIAPMYYHTISDGDEVLRTMVSLIPVILALVLIASCAYSLYVRVGGRRE